MATDDFPLPEVQEALGPFIKPRDEVARIRGDLHSHLHKQLKLDVPLTSTNLPVQPEGQNIQDAPPSSLTSVRRAYLKALQAHAAAQTRYDTLKADLIRMGAEIDSDSSKPKPNLVNENYLPLLRQRERHRKLLVLDHTFTQISSAGKGVVDGHLDDIVKQQAGDLPIPPTAHAPAFSEEGPDVHARILILKKAVLSTKRNIDQQQRSSDATPRRRKSNGSTKSLSTDPETAGLQSALNVLTGWMENQLLIIGESSPSPTPTTSTPPSKPHPAQPQDISTLYTSYTLARQTLLTLLTHPPTPIPSPLTPSHSLIPSPSTSSSIKSAAELLLPHLPILHLAKQEETDLVQQSTHLRRAITYAEGEGQKLLGRLAEESRLVHPGAEKGEEWAEAAREAEGEGRDEVGGRIRDGEVRVREADVGLSGIAGVGIVLEGLVGE